MAHAGQRPWRRISNDREFFIMTLPTTSTGTAQVLPGRGVKIHYIYYWSDLFRDPEVERKQVPVRYDPFDAGTAFAFVKGQWVHCHSEYYAIFQGHSERELMLATQELRKTSAPTRTAAEPFRKNASAISCNRLKRRRSCSLNDSAIVNPERHGMNRNR